MPPTMAAGYHDGSRVTATRPAPTARASIRGSTSKPVMRRALPTPMAYHVMDSPDIAAATHMSAASPPVPPGDATTESATAAGVTTPNTPSRSHHDDA